MNIVAIVGSLRKDSYNRKIAEFMKNRYKGKMNIEILNIGSLPLFSEDIEDDPPTVVKEFKNQIKSS